MNRLELTDAQGVETARTSVKLVELKEAKPPEGYEETQTTRKSLFSIISFYTCIDAKYLSNKMVNILIPYVIKKCKRKRASPIEVFESPVKLPSSDENETTPNKRIEADFLGPLSDTQSPDLYIPILSFLTALLITILGLTGEKIKIKQTQYTLLKYLIIWTLDSYLLYYLIDKMGLNILKFPLIESFCLCGYKFFYLTVLKIILMMMNSTVKTIFLICGMIFFSISNGYYFTRNLQPFFEDDIVLTPVYVSKYVKKGNFLNSIFCLELGLFVLFIALNI